MTRHFQWHGVRWILAVGKRQIHWQLFLFK
jgi:hypothetical protein